MVLFVTKLHNFSDTYKYNFVFLRNMLVIKRKYSVLLPFHQGISLQFAQGRHSFSSFWLQAVSNSHFSFK